MIEGVRYFLSSISFINEHSLWKYILIPIFLSAIVGISLIFLLAIGIYELSYSLLISFLGEEITWVLLLLKILAGFISTFLVLFFYRQMASLVVYPFLTPLIEKVEEIYLGKKKELSFKEELIAGFYSFLSSWKLLFKEMGYLFLASFIPAVQFLFYLLIEGYFLGRNQLE